MIISKTITKNINFNSIFRGNRYALIVQVTDKVARVSESSEVRLEVIEQK